MSRSCANTDVEKNVPKSPTTSAAEFTFHPADLGRFYRFVKLDRHNIAAWFSSSAINSTSLLIFRMICALHTLVVLVVDFFYDRNMLYRARYALYFTYVTNFVLFVYFAFTSWYGVRLARCKSDQERLDFYKGIAHWKLFLMHFVYTSSFSFHVIVPSVYWNLVYDSAVQRDSVAWWTNISTHCVPIILLVMEFAINDRYAVFQCDGITLISFMLVYVAWVWLGAAIHCLAGEKPWLPYKFLHLHKPTNLYYYLGIFLGCIVLFEFTFGLHYLKRRFANRSKK